jgi:hypothetical protein
MNIKEITTKINNCLDCPFHKVLRDPDPHDWFCDDDEKTICTKVINPKTGQHKVVTSGNRPYQTRKESMVPDWCPL